VSKQNYEAAQKPGVYELCLVIGLDGDYWKDWETESVLCYWIQADAFVAKKRRGEIERNVFSAIWTCTVSDVIYSDPSRWTNTSSYGVHRLNTTKQEQNLLHLGKTSLLLILWQKHSD
jgi:hypothetical protein